MKYYKLFLIAAVITIIVLFLFFPRVSAHASTNTLPNVQKAPVTQQIAQYASYYGVDGKLALAIAKCESRLNPLAKSKISTAKGIYQFLDSSWKEYSLKRWRVVKDVFDDSSNIELGIWLLSIEGTAPWKSSEACWD